MRQYREANGFELDALAQALRVSPAKLEALEADRLGDLPDAMFARALALAVCRQLKTDAAPVLALLPGKDVSRLAARNERGLNFPLERPSLLPQSSFLVVTRLLTPVRWVALAILLTAIVIGFWPTLHDLLVFKNDPALDVITTPGNALPSTLPTAQMSPVDQDSNSNNLVVTTVHSAALAQTAASAAAIVSSSGASDAR
jgi:cytoskeletal protein RodZ